jgi:putative nucleotidyltransferase with HDIG domain
MANENTAPRFLIVDDEIASRTKMRAILSTFGVCEDVDNGKDAVESFKNALRYNRPFTIIALDINMPEMDGSGVLELIREEEAKRKTAPSDRVKVIMVTASSDRDSLVTCVQLGCDDYLIKPFTRETLSKKIIDLGFTPLDEETLAEQQKSERRMERIDIGMEVMRRFAQGEMDLPRPSRIYSQFLDLVREEATIQDIADLLKKDVGLTVVLIGVSNSVYYRGVEENKTLAQALNRMGLEETKKYVTLICNREFYRTKSSLHKKTMERLWEHSLASAIAAEIVTNKLKLDFADDIFTMGLLHDVGKYVLINFVEELQEKGVADTDSSREDFGEVMNKYHGKFGAVLFDKWGFSDKYIQTAMYHDDLSGTKQVSRELLVIHFANILVKSMGYGQDEDEIPELDQAASTRHLGLTESQIEEIKAELAEKMEEAQMIMAESAVP